MLLILHQGNIYLFVKGKLDFILLIFIHGRTEGDLEEYCLNLNIQHISLQDWCCGRDSLLPLMLNRDSSRSGTEESDWNFCTLWELWTFPESFILCKTKSQTQALFRIKFLQVINFNIRIMFYLDINILITYFTSPKCIPLLWR